MDSLFPPSDMAMDSPRLAWLKQHDLITTQQGYPFTEHPLSWMCSNRAMTICGYGATEADAILDYCARHKIKHWTLQ